MARLTNPWIGYSTRDWTQIRQNVLTKFQSLVPEITDHTETNPWVKGISVWGGLAEMLGYYIDTTAREVYISTLREFESAVKLAKLFDYRIQGRIGSKVTVTFTLSGTVGSDLLIPAGTKISTDDGVEFLTDANATIPTGILFITVGATQRTKITDFIIGTSDGSLNQIFVIQTDVEDKTITIKADVDVFVSQETLGFSVPTDRHFVAGLDELSQMTVRFGDDVTGEVPQTGLDVLATFFTTLGVDGDVGANEITNIDDVIVIPGGSETLSVDNTLKSVGGTEAEDLDDLRKRIPVSIRTLLRAVTDLDYKDIAELINGVAVAGATFNCTTRVVEISIAPDGGGIPPVALLDAVKADLEIKKTIGLTLDVTGAGEVNFLIDADIQVLPGFVNIDVSDDIKTALVAHLSSANKDLFDSVNLGDLYQVIEEVDGVDHSIINTFISVPHARPLGSNVTQLTWDRELLPASSTTVKWLIRFISATQFELHKDDVFIAVFLVDVQVVQTEFEFTINGNQVSGQEWETFTYVYNANVTLVEPSVPVTDIASITLTVTGGI